MSSTRRTIVPDSIALLVADVDGTLITPDKIVTANAAAAIRRLSEAGIGFTLVSSRPPRGLAPLVSLLNIVLPFAAFNGGALAASDLSLIESHHLAELTARATLDLFSRRAVDAWIFADDAWLLRDPVGLYVEDHRRTVGFDPVVVPNFDNVIDRIDKIVDISSQPTLLAEVVAEARVLLRGQVTVDLSRASFLDFTHREANKGRAVQSICAILGVDVKQTAVIGDMTNDVSMFDVAGFSIAMGQAPDAVKAHADAVTGSNADEGFADAVARFVLPHAARNRVTS